MELLVEISLGILGLVVIIGILFFTHGVLKNVDTERKRKVEARLSKLDMNHIAQVYTPDCHVCNGVGVVEERHGALVHTTTKESCSCRFMENWLLSLIDKWTEEGQIQPAVDLLLILQKKL